MPWQPMHIAAFVSPALASCASAAGARLANERAASAEIIEENSVFMVWQAV